MRCADAGLVRRAWRLVAAHLILQLAAPQFWHALALAAIAGMLAVPADVLRANSWLRSALPIALAMIGTIVYGLEKHPHAKQRAHK